jgi:pimeloyl-ACP methyl ester carboxylesterase
MNFRIVGAILRKDLLSLYPLALLTALLFAVDVFILRWELVPLWAQFRPLLLVVTGALATLAVFQLDAPVSLVDDWLCRPVPRRELVVAKLAFPFAVIYLPAAVATLIADLCLGASLAESLQDAVLLRDEYFPYAPLVIPLLLLTAIVTRTLVQGMGLLIALFACMFVIPTPFVHAPDPSTLAFGDEALLGAGLGWLSLAPAKVVPLLLAALGFWLVYAGRRILLARALLVLTAGVMVFLFLLPMWLLPWQGVMAAQARLNPVEAPADVEPVYLRQTRTCFPATRLAEAARDPAFTAAREASGLRMWSNEDLSDTGPDSIAFITPVEPRRVPVDWRVKLDYVRADYFAGQATPVVSLRPAAYAQGLSQAWVLPASALDKLRGRQTSLKLSYSFTLLAPRNYSLRVDGRHHALPGLGYCSAGLNASFDHIDVECLSAFRRPAQLSAQLDDIAASRAAAPPDLSPAWTQWLFSQRVKLAIHSPRLAQHDTVTVTAWDVAAYVDRSLTLPGLLGADSATCGLPTSDGNFLASRWRDAAPHEPASVKVEEGVQLEVLDFGGTGSPLLLLPGLGATAHSYDELAPLLARHHRVVAMTRRGGGYSSKPDFGYDTPRLAQDVLAVMDAMELRKAVLVGHSIAGEELTWLGGHHPQRFDGLVYLDAAYDRSNPRANPTLARLRELNNRVPPAPPVPPRALLNYESMTRWLEQSDRVRLPEGELIATWQVDKPFLGGTPSVDARTQQAIQAAIQPPDYGAVKIPALAIYAIDDPDLRSSRDVNDAELMATLAEIRRLRDELQRQNIERFRTEVRGGEVLELQNARHYIVQSNTQEVFAAIEAFVTRISCAATGTTGAAGCTSPPSRPPHH